MKLSSTAKRVLNLLNKDTSMMYPMEYITETLNLQPNSVLTSISMIKKVHTVEKYVDKEDNKTRYYSLKV
jgi:hypothetical protein